MGREKDALDLVDSEIVILGVYGTPTTKEHRPSLPIDNHNFVYMIATIDMSDLNASLN